MFISCSVELDYLGPLLSEIVVALTSFIKKFPETVSEILKYLIIEHRYVHVHVCRTMFFKHGHIWFNRDQLSGYFSEVYMIPDVPSLSEVNKILKQTLLSSIRYGYYSKYCSSWFTCILLFMLLYKMHFSFFTGPICCEAF